MSFSIDWLDLREPADQRARDKRLIDTLAEWFAGKTPRILDLGSGTGSSYRGLSPHIGGYWTLTDIDKTLLDEATRRHGDEPSFAGTRNVDLMTGLEALIAEIKPDLVCCSALLDLASADWLDRLIAALPPTTATYMTLSYNGYEQWAPTPPHEHAAQMAFKSHQLGDKGFGPALGPHAASNTANALSRGGWDVDVADSPWILDHNDAALIAALASGSAEAVAETEELSPEMLREWAAGRAAAQTVTVGHIDLLAFPRD